MSREEAAAAPAAVELGADAGGLAEARRLSWRRPATAATLRRDGRRWTVWTCGVVVSFGAPGVLALALSPWLLPVALIFFGHGWAICRMQAARGTRAVVAIGGEHSAADRPGVGQSAERTALGLLGDLLDHAERDLLQRTGLALQRGRLGVWLVGERGALMVRPGGRRVDCWCVRVAQSDDLPAGDRVAHLLLALREDEAGFATVANFNFSGAWWRVRRRMSGRQRPALDAARADARGSATG
jgi:hypothetical protein